MQTDHKSRLTSQEETRCIRTGQRGPAGDKLASHILGVNMIQRDRLGNSKLRKPRRDLKRVCGLHISPLGQAHPERCRAIGSGPSERREDVLDDLTIAVGLDVSLQVVETLLAIRNWGSLGPRTCRRIERAGFPSEPGKVVQIASRL